MVLSPTLVVDCLEDKWPAQGLSLAVLRGQGHLQATLLCLLSVPKQISQRLSRHPPMCPPVLTLFH